MKVIAICRHESEEHKQEEPTVLKVAADYIKDHGYHFTEDLADYAISKMVNVDNTKSRISKTQIELYMNQHGLSIPVKSNLYDILYTANMAYADFYPKLLDSVDKCIEYAFSVVEDVDGYEGVAFCRWIADIMGKNVKINWDNFI